MIEPFGEILKQYYPDLRELGFRTASEGLHAHSFASRYTQIEFNVDKYVPADIRLNFVANTGARYPLWQFSQLIDMQGYNCDKHKLDQIKIYYGLHDGDKGPTLFNAGVKIYASTYIEQAVSFLSKYQSIIKVDTEDFISHLPRLECG